MSASPSPALAPLAAASDAALAPDPLTPFDVPGGPPVGLALGAPASLAAGDRTVIITLTPAHIEQAYLRFLASYQGEAHAPTRERARKSRDALLKRAWRVVSCDEHLPGAADAGHGSVLHLPGSASDTYAVDDHDCRVANRRSARGGPVYCPDSLFATVRASHRASGDAYPVACYHTCARELLRLAAAIAAQEELERLVPSRDVPRPARRLSDPLDTDCAASVLPALDLWAACFLMQRAGGTVTIRAAGGDLALSCGRRRVVLAGAGDGSCAVTVDVEAFAQLLLAPLTTRAQELGPVEVIIDLAGDAPAVAFSASDFGALAPATPTTH